MIRTLIAPAAAALLLAGCVTTADYRYSQGRGDYYYGQPVIEYHEHTYGYPWGFYGYYGYPRAGWHLGFRYGYPYYRYYGWYPYYGYPYYGYPHPYVHRRPVRPTEPTVDPTPDRPRSPWRDLEHLRRRSEMRDQALRTTIEEPGAPWQLEHRRGSEAGGADAPRRPREWVGEMRPRPVEPVSPPVRTAPRVHQDRDPAAQAGLPWLRERDEDHTP